MVKSTRVKAISMLAAVFLLGVLAGGAGTYAYALRQQARMVGPGGLEHRRVGFERRLGLTRAQSVEIAAILARNDPEMDRLKAHMVEECGAQMRAHVERVDAEIRAVLDPEQQQRFDALREERRQRGLIGFGPEGPPPWGGGRGRGPGPAGGPPRAPAPRRSSP
ncbi:MAG: hypothetical protein JW751_15095 [Polyangiaceae bacterium]|nr:hypothetical protein [Polyangiaceae bacterium]